MITRQPWPLSDCAQPLYGCRHSQTTATLPAIITSLARLMPSISEWRQPYRLSNLLLVTESLTLIAGKGSSPFFCISYRRCTPVVVSSLTPRTFLQIRSHLPGDSFCTRRTRSRNTMPSSDSSAAGCGTEPLRLNSAPLTISSVASPPSSTIRSGPLPSGQVSISSVHHQYSSSVSPFQ